MTGSANEIAIETAALQQAVADAVARALAEDLGGAGDITSESAIDPSATGSFAIRAREGAVVAGLACVGETARACGAVYEAHAADGDAIAPGAVVARLRGSIRSILAAERTALNFLGLLSGTATVTRAFVQAVRDVGSSTTICATRKTIPGLRALQKHAVSCGGGDPHRFGLFDAVLLKDNHLAGLSPAQVARVAAEASACARARHSPAFVCCEVDSLEQLDALLRLPAGVLDIVLLDNFPCGALAQAVRRRDAAARPGTSALLLEASGGVTLATVADIARTGVDRMSVGALTHSVRSMDFGLDAE
ncbi:MAG: carboxylating nicotinate-nucleotide diphosphorylase [Planctomycetota bacterium]|nr:carboxylating nicotinate-nucleotide diphosphorylase [Planctomycetota bacterium]